MIYRFKGVRAKQAPNHDVFTFAATPKEILSFSEIERIGRNEEGHLRGFQRHQVASHIKEIRDYLSREDALLPNAVILAFLDGVTTRDLGDNIVEIVIDSTVQKPGFVVDGQQRLSALATMEKGDFQVFVSGLVCKDYNELRQQFVLINNSRPLPKSLIYELLPSVEGLPERFTKRKFASRIIDLLNSTTGSSLYCEIKQHTNPRGVLSDTAIQKFVMNSASNGAIQTFMQYDDFEGRSIDLINNFFHAVRTVFRPEWDNLSPRHSRLRHGAGIVSLGFVMDEIFAKQETSKKEDFIEGLQTLKQHTAWTSGQWKFSESDIRPWNGVQNTPSDIELLSNFLIQKIRKKHRQKQNEIKA